MTLEKVIRTICEYPSKWFENFVIYPFPKRVYRPNEVFEEHVSLREVIAAKQECLCVMLRRKGAVQHFHYYSQERAAADRRYYDCVLLLRADELLRE